ncbi:MAG: hypothetical protein HUU14_11885, partial [Dehalococcoidia bacterium]|nr:hypothetical protein [Dehalococcoidia bacterium]
LALAIIGTNRRKWIWSRSLDAFPDIRALALASLEAVGLKDRADEPARLLSYGERRQLELALALWPGMESLRIPGSAALGIAYVAAGRWDIFLHADLQAWDLAAGLLLVREAGGIVTDREGRPATIFSKGLIAATPAVHADFMQRAGHLPWRE